MKKGQNKVIFLSSMFINVLILLSAVLFVTLYTHKNSETEAEKLSADVSVVLDETNKDTAVKHLSVLRGRLVEIQILSHYDIQNALMHEINAIATYQDIANPYLKDFKFVVPNSSNIGEICEELISQIDDQVSIIRFGEKDA